MGIFNKVKKPTIMELIRKNNDLIAHVTLGGSVEALNPKTDEWEVVDPTFDPDIEYRPYNGVNLAVRQARNLTDLRNQTSQHTVAVAGLKETVLQLQNSNKALTHSNSLLSRQLEQPAETTGCAAPKPAPSRIAVVGHADFKAGQVTKCNDDREFLVLADKAVLMAQFGYTYNEAVDPDGKQLIVMRDNPKKNQPFAVTGRTAAGNKNKDGAPSQLDLLYVTSNKPVQQPEMVNGMILVTRRSGAKDVYIDPTNGELRLI